MQTLTVSTTQKKGKLVGTKHVDELVRNYKKERWIQNSQRMGKVDSLSTWYGLTELSSFLELAKQNKADGIKMHYGVYPSDFPEVPELAGRQTVVLIATKQRSIGNAVVNKEIYVTRDGRSEILAFNFGSICPPFCGGGDGELTFDMSRIGISIIDEGGSIIIS